MFFDSAYVIIILIIKVPGRWGVMEDKMSKKKKTMLALAIILGIAAVGLAAGVYAKYIASLTSNSGNISVAKWAFKAENEGKADLLKCELDKTYDAATLVAGKIAPGTKGVCEFKLSNEQSEVGVDYTIVASASNKPTNLKFYSDSSYNTPLTAAGITGHLDAGANKDAQTRAIYWRWEYETGDDAASKAAGDDIDTQEGMAAGNMTIDFQISGVQVQPR